MLNNLILSELSSELAASLNSASNVSILSAYLTEPAVDFLFTNVSSDVTARIVIRARPEDLLNGSCDIRALKALVYSGFECFINRALHAKLYVIDKSVAFVGSANLTSNGLKLSGYGNIEISTKVEMSEIDNQLLESIISDSIKVDFALCNLLENLVTESKKNTEIKLDGWWDKIISLPINSLHKGLYVGDLPWCNPYNNNSVEATQHDQDIFGFGSPNCKVRFLNSHIYTFILEKINGLDSKEAFFGEVTEWVHNALKDDTLPYRSEVKDYVSNLYAYIEYYASDTLLVDRPNYSQRLSLICQ